MVRMSGMHDEVAPDQAGPAPSMRRHGGAKLARDQVSQPVVRIGNRIKSVIKVNGKTMRKSH
ncbi:hypothetical protein ACV229_28695 [Burkholderia sp. MR1-5-21]